MQVLDSYDFNVVKKQLSNTYDIDDIGLIIDEFKKFLALKVFENDMNAEKLSPSAVIDQAWHSLILVVLLVLALLDRLHTVYYVKNYQIIKLILLII